MPLWGMEIGMEIADQILGLNAVVNDAFPIAVVVVAGAFLHHRAQRRKPAISDTVDARPEGDTRVRNFGWVLTSRRAIWLSRLACLVGACGIAVTLFINVADLIRDRPFTWAVYLFVPGVPAIALGQVWALAVLSTRRPQNVRRGFGSWRVRARPEEEHDPGRFFFEGLPPFWADAIKGLFGLGVLSALTATSFRSVPASQRFGAGIAMGFFAFHFGISAAELARRRSGNIQSLLPYGDDPPAKPDTEYPARPL
jgi:hypothetical protein